jgi:hypothetical protein
MMTMVMMAFVMAFMMAIYDDGVLRQWNDLTAARRDGACFNVTMVLVTMTGASSTQWRLRGGVLTC